MRLISIPEYAASRKARGLSGGTRQAVHKAAKAGRIALVDGKVDPVDADARWLTDTSVDQQNRGSAGKAEEGEAYLTARARKEAALADMAEMEAAELRGELIRRAAIVEHWGKMATSFRARMLVIPPTLAPRIAPPGKVAEVQQDLQRAIHEALTELADG